jgi:hypothetical protein
MQRKHWSLSLTSKGLRKARLIAQGPENETLAKAWELADGRVAWQILRDACTLEPTGPRDHFSIADSFEQAMQSLERYFAVSNEIPSPHITP